MVRHTHILSVGLLFACINFPSVCSASTHSPAVDQSAVLQLVLDHPRLQPFLHPKLPGRVPVTVFVRAPVPGITAEKFGAPVRILTSDSHLAPAVIRLTRFSVSDGAAAVSLHYPIEGVRGSFRLQRDGRIWRVTDADVHES
jgi:hypothetical protein